MENFAFRKNTLNTRGNGVDRFIHPREYLTDLQQHWRPHIRMRNKNILDTKFWNQKDYVNRLDKAFGVEEESDKYVVKPWPCIPRRKSYLTSADSVLDLPTFSKAESPELLDWSSNNILVAALGKNYFKWSWGSQKLSGRGWTNYKIRSCKFDPRGELLLLGTDSNSIWVHDNERSKLVSYSRCVCRYDNFCSITSLDWSPTGNAFVTGCTRGKVASFTRSSQPISFIRKVRANQRQPIFSVRISPDARFAAITTLHSTEVLLVTWPHLRPIHIFEFEDSFTTAISWHPWRSALLGRGALTKGVQTRVAMCCAPTGDIKEATLDGEYTLDAMLFSHKTGELTMSLYNIESGLIHPETSSHLVVLSDLKTVVDQWRDDGRTGLNRVRTMVFSPDGTKLATATSNEDLIIWNFLPERKQKSKSKMHKFSAIPVYLDVLTPGCALR